MRLFLYGLGRELRRKGCSSLGGLHRSTEQHASRPRSRWPQSRPHSGRLLSNLENRVEELGAGIDRFSPAEQDNPGDLTEKLLREY